MFLPKKHENCFKSFYAQEHSKFFSGRSEESMYFASMCAFDCYDSLHKVEQTSHTRGHGSCI